MGVEYTRLVKQTNTTMHSHSDVEERDLGPPMTPFYTAATQALLPL